MSDRVSLPASSWMHYGLNSDGGAAKVEESVIEEREHVLGEVSRLEGDRGKALRLLKLLRTRCGRRPARSAPSLILREPPRDDELPAILDPGDLAAVLHLQHRNPRRSLMDAAAAGRRSPIAPVSPHRG